MGTKSNLLQGIVIEFDSINNYPKIVKDLTLQELIELKQATVTKIKSLVGSLTGRQTISLDYAEKIINQIEALQYNLTIFKQLNAIANVGSPEKNMLGINGCIYQSSDLKSLNLVMNKVANTITFKKGDLRVRDYFHKKIAEYKKVIDSHYREQTKYNSSMKIRVEYLDIKL